MRTRVSIATRRAVTPGASPTSLEPFAVGRLCAVAPVRCLHRLLSLRLHLDQADGAAVATGDVETDDLTRQSRHRASVGRGAQLEPLLAEGRPRVADADRAAHLVRIAVPVDAVLGRIDLRGIRRFALLCA